MTHAEATKTFASERYILGEMSEHERDAFEEHFFSCTECADDVRSGAQMHDGVRAGLLPRASANERSSVWSGWRIPVLMPWAMAATLAGVVAYQSLWQMPELRRQVAPQALEPIWLRPATRGAAPVVNLRFGRPVSLSVEVNAPDGVRELSYALQDDNGVTISSGRATTPVPGTPLLLLFPSANFAKPGPYVLRVGDALASGPALGVSHFSVQP
jgi:hypothetical protein